MNRNSLPADWNREASSLPDTPYAHYRPWLTWRYVKAMDLGYYRTTALRLLMSSVYSFAWLLVALWFVMYGLLDEPVGSEQIGIATAGLAVVRFYWSVITWEATIRHRALLIDALHPGSFFTHAQQDLLPAQVREFERATEGQAVVAPKRRRL